MGTGDREPDSPVAGVDGCRNGWIAILLQNGTFHEARYATNIRDLLQSLVAVTVIAVDIPIGIDGAYPRTADIAARDFVGGRRSSVFMTPPRQVLEATDYFEATRTAKQLIGVGISRQAFGLALKIQEVDVVAPNDSRVVEVHPEVSFRAMAGDELLHSKKSWNGLREREELLLDVGITIPPNLPVPDSVASDDVLDACAAAWSALRYDRGEAKPLPATAPQRAPTIWY
jgi:predicted RNase H-like nuclease